VSIRLPATVYPMQPCPSCAEAGKFGQCGPMRDPKVDICRGKERAALRLRSDPAELALLIGFARRFADDHALPHNERARLLIILEELFTNVVNHGYDGAARSGRIEITLALEAGRLNMVFNDDGRPFDPLTGAVLDLDQLPANRRIGGLGLHIVRSLVDHARYFRSGDRNHLVLARAVSAKQRGASSESFEDLVGRVRACALCAPYLPFGPRPILRGRPSARLLIVSQAPGKRAHETGMSFNDRSGDRLRGWLALDRDVFYDEARVAIMPIGFCYPGGDLEGGDLPPRPECAPLWHGPLRAFFPAVELTLLVGSCAIDYYLPRSGRRSMTATIARWRDFLPDTFVLPHPSWHATRWLRDHPWFEKEAVPELRARVGQTLNPTPRSAPYPRR
jgi:uracil-DNA glycosylase/anti-sigma regulatory factor (Ser/Thr protein kinase)